MPPAIVRLTAFTRKNRHHSMADLDEAIADAGGWISAHTLFSNISASVAFSLPTGGLGDFLARATRAGITFDAGSRGRLMDGDAPRQSGDDIPLSLNITFIHDEPDLRREVPAVPG